MNFLLFWSPIHALFRVILGIWPTELTSKILSCSVFEEKKRNDATETEAKNLVMHTLQKDTEKARKTLLLGVEFRYVTFLWWSWAKLFLYCEKVASQSIVSLISLDTLGKFSKLIVMLTQSYAFHLIVNPWKYFIHLLTWV